VGDGRTSPDCVELEVVFALGATGVAATVVVLDRTGVGDVLGPCGTPLLTFTGLDEVIGDEDVVTADFTGLEAATGDDVATLAALGDADEVGTAAIALLLGTSAAGDEAELDVSGVLLAWAITLECAMTCA